MYVIKATPEESKAAYEKKFGKTSSYVVKGAQQPTQLIKPDAYSPNFTNASSVRDISANIYGGLYDYDEATIRKKFMDATKAEYDAKRAANAQAQTTFANNLGATAYQVAQLNRDELRKSIATGGSLGAQAASNYANILGLQQQSVAEASQLAQAQRQIEYDRAAALAKDIVEAEALAAQRLESMSTLSNNIFANQVQQQVADASAQSSMINGYNGAQGQIVTADTSGNWGYDTNMVNALNESAKIYGESHGNNVAVGIAPRAGMPTFEAQKAKQQNVYNMAASMMPYLQSVDAGALLKAIETGDAVALANAIGTFDNTPKTSGYTGSGGYYPSNNTNGTQDPTAATYNLESLEDYEKMGKDGINERNVLKYATFLHGVGVVPTVAEARSLAAYVIRRAYQVGTAELYPTNDILKGYETYLKTGKVETPVRSSRDNSTTSPTTSPTSADLPYGTHNGTWYGTGGLW